MTIELTFYTIMHENELVQLDKITRPGDSYSVNYNDWPDGAFYVAVRDDGSRPELHPMFNEDLLINGDPRRYILYSPGGSVDVVQLDYDGQVEVITIDGRTMDVVHGLLQTVVFDMSDHDVDELIYTVSRSGVQGVVKNVENRVYGSLSRLPNE